MYILGISGRKQSGKTSIARYLANTLTTPTTAVAIISFADELKRIIRATLVPQDWPEARLPWDEDGIKNVTLPCGWTIREALQVVGTSWFRNRWPHVWVNAWKSRLAGIKRTGMDNFIVITPDVRFTNEVEAIQQMGGHVIRLTRRGSDNDPHPSETALDEQEEVQLAEGVYPSTCFDAIIKNHLLTLDEQNADVLNVLRRTGWIGAIP
jgi:hypothetical protein